MTQSRANNLPDIYSFTSFNVYSYQHEVSLTQTKHHFVLKSSKQIEKENFITKKLIQQIIKKNIARNLQNVSYLNQINGLEILCSSLQLTSPILIHDFLIKLKIYSSTQLNQALNLKIFWFSYFNLAGVLRTMFSAWIFFKLFGEIFINFQN